MKSKNWFEQGGENYAKYRPEYPTELSDYLASISLDTSLAVDVGCGNGQLTNLLASHFTNVVGIDPSQEQLAHAKPNNNVKYICASAEKIPLDNGCAGLITAAQAAHWFNLPVFYKEAQRIAKTNATLALVSYGVLKLHEDIDVRFQRFYTHEIGPYWPAERKLVDSGYSTIDFPFEEITAPPMQICLSWTLEEFLGYISTWSAVRKAQEVGRDNILHKFAEDISNLWSNPNTKYPISWPINLRIGRI